MKIRILFFAVTILWIASCSKDEIDNRLPETPTLIEPANLSGNIATNVILTWSFSDDMDGDAVKYSVYLDTETNPTTLVSEDQFAASFQTTLQMNSTYFWKVVAEDSYGNQVETAVWSFSTGQYSWSSDGITGIFIDLRDGKEYKIVKIGSQVWMAENLAYLPSVDLLSNGSEDSGFEDEAFYYVYNYNGDDVSMAKASENYQKYGVLYNWTAAASSNPEGWHLASSDEWEMLGLYVSNEQGPYEKDYTGYWPGVPYHLNSTLYWTYGQANDTYGFTALPAGYRTDNNQYSQLGGYATWWTSTPVVSDDEGIFRGTTNSYATITGYFSQGVASKNFARSVRCIMD